MSCETIQNRLLAQFDGKDLPIELAQHLASCELCQRYQSRLQQLQVELVNLAVPTSETRKLAFIEELTALGPVVRTRPMPLSQTRDLPWASWLKSSGKPIMSTAAAVLVGVGVWWMWPERSKVPTDAQGPRSELVQKLIRYQSSLATAEDPKSRLAKLTELAADLRGEARGVCLAVTTNDEMRTISRMFDQVVNQGILPQAKDLSRQSPLSERRASLGEAAQELALASNELANMPAATPAQEYLARMAETARSAQAELYRLAKEGV